MKRIILTGGGTAGHVTPNIALLPRLKELGYDIQYIGSYEGIEKKLIEEMQIPYYGISSGKLRRYFDLKNFSDFQSHQRIYRSTQINEKIKTRHRLFQRRICLCSCSDGCASCTHPGNLP